MKIFLIDDEWITNIINSKLIKTIEPSFEIAEFNDPMLAYKQLKYEQPDIIFLDLNMPHLSGWDFLDKMQQDKINCDVIILSSSVSQFDNNKAHDYYNVVKYMEKPLNLFKLKECLLNYVVSHY